ncbi:MAG: Phosphomannomutase / Phosphoglucomutase [Candidatus Ozemobacter sibiricus]|jgi:alpha-D-glucose phosphate-specific phosphoglucomutase|uniref:Phosphomannomutase / Phosphoglucomutase n=1 Tax=Candidatus Ozemobacter sibiricus TaxID=2268124 RepID=A0A367ZU60_9BACT|nr:MAG: Phosphomannomutase / Phosphoglucomutase [Candidatus Ozemobacter sibiricus]
MEIKFGTSGWRDIIADGFTFQNVRICTQAIADHLNAHGKTGGVVIGSDTRFLSSRFMETAAEVLAANGIKSYLCIRDTPTPVISHEILRRKAAGGFNFTASHNPPEYQGLKFSPDWGGPALPETTGDIERRANALLKNGPAPKTMPLAEALQQGRVEKIDPMEPYLATLREKVRLEVIKKAGLKILVNPLYGTARGYLDRLLREAGCQIEVMNDHLDPYFGNQPPEPSESHIPDMIARMREGDFDLGLATDGDADRFGILGRGGKFFEPNQILGLMLDHLKTSRGWTGGVARSVATTHLIDAVAQHHGIEVFETPVGFKYIGDLIAKDKILLGGEESAGLSIKGHVPEKDGIIACLLVAEMVASRGQSLDQLLADLYRKVGTYVTRRLNFRLTPEQKQRAEQKIREPFKEIAGFKVGNTVKIDGTKFLLENGAWVLLRFSGTEPVVRYYAEARSPEVLDALCAFGEKLLKG